MSGDETPTTLPKPSASRVETTLGVAVLICGVLVLFDWIGGSFFDDWAGFGFVMLLAIGLLALVVEGLTTGKLAIRGGNVFRDKNPVAFWCFVVFYVVVSLGMTAFAFFGDLS